MTDTDKKRISKIVEDVIRDQGGTGHKDPKTPPLRNGASRKGPAVLYVFHAGLRKLDEAIEQVKRIDRTALRSSVYTSESVREVVWSSNLNNGNTVRSNLDKAKPAGIEKTLEKSDIVILPTFCVGTAAKIARLICADMASSIVLKALLQNKKIIATTDGFLLCDLLVNEALRYEIDRILKKLEGFGMVFCTTDQLYETLQKTVAVGKKVQSPPVGEEKSFARVSLITAKIVNTAVEEKIDRIDLAPGGKVTPLARDLAKEYGIRIVDSPEGDQ